MAEAVIAFAARDSEGRRGLGDFLNAVRADSVGEGRPGRGVLELLGAQEELISTLRTQVYPYSNRRGRVVHTRLQSKKLWE